VAQNKKESVKAKILKAAKKEFLAYGFKSSSMRNIAADAGVSLGSYRVYFKNKEDIFNAVKDTVEDKHIQDAMEFEKKWSHEGKLIKNMSDMLALVNR
jgi:AcrR family transcriptional regulator